MPLARNLNHVLNSVGAPFESLFETWEEKAPALAAFVVNKQTGMPGPGFDGRLIGHRDFTSFSPEEQQAYLDAAFRKIYKYACWR